MPTPSTTPIVGVIMGSQSDWQVMKEASNILTEFGVPHENRVVSAHRTPYRLTDYVVGERDRGIRFIIAGAGGAAHLPGMAAAFGPLTVIGVPVKSRALSGVDSLYSIVQMPPGVPVGCMAIDGAKNAGLYAVSILSAFDDALHAKWVAWRERQAGSIAFEPKDEEPKP